MKAVIQRVLDAKVEVDHETVAVIGRGLLVLVGVGREDAEADAAYLARKIAALRVFADADGKMNLSLGDTGGEVLAVSQFTLYGDTRRGNRPGFDAAAAPEEGRRLYGAFVSALEGQGLAVKTGVFGAHMKVSLTNDGPVTILIDSSQRNQPR